MSCKHARRHKTPTGTEYWLLLDDHYVLWRAIVVGDAVNLGVRQPASNNDEGGHAVVETSKVVNVHISAEYAPSAAEVRL